MPHRILRDGILTSGPVDTLTCPAEVFYRRMMSVVDDFGRFDARPAILRAACFPLRIDKVREADITRWLHELETAGLIALYAVDGKPYLVFLKLGKPRAQSSRFPDPPADLRPCAHLRADESNRTQVQADVPYSNSGSYSNAHSGTLSTESCAEPPQASASAPPAAADPPSLVVLEFPLAGRKAGSWALTESHVAEYALVFPGIDVIAECRKARQWCVDNPAKRKTRNGIKSFLTRWLTKAQDRGSPLIGAAPARDENGLDPSDAAMLDRLHGNRNGGHR